MKKSPLQAMMGMASHQDEEMPRNDMMDSQSTEDSEPPAEEASKDMPNCIGLPKGLKTPDGAKEGDSFQGTFRGSIKDGKLYFDSINNIPLGKEEGTPEEEASETPEEESTEDQAGTEQPMDDSQDSTDAKDLDYEDKKYRKTQKENHAFKRAFQGMK